MAYQNAPTTARRDRGVGGPSRGQDRQVAPTRGLGTSSTSRIARPIRNNQVAPSQGSFFAGANDLDINGGQFNMTRGHHTNLTINFNQGGHVDSDEAELGGDEERRQAHNVSVRTPEQAIPVPDQQQQPRRRPSLPVQKSCDIYYRHLSVKGRGSPLWVPEPNTELPLEYQRRGISIGDVGIITDYGGFDFLFNICLPRDDPINAEDVPENFAPLKPPLRPSDVRGHSGFRPNSYLSSGSIERSRGDSDPSGLTFETTESEGAILTMPQGSTSKDLGSVIRFRKYMSANAEDWYRYVHDVRGREARNGDVRLVVGWDQTTTWGMATFTQTTAQNRFRLKFGPVGESSVGRTYGWEYAGMAEVRAGPDSREIEVLRANDSSEDGIIYENQCLFVRTLNATLDNDVWDKLVSETDMSYVQNDPSTFDSYTPSSFHPSNPSGSTTGGSTSNPGGQSGARGASRMADTVSPISSQSVHVSDLPTALAAHPSKVINEMLLKERPNARMAITEDKDWISVISKDDLVLPPADQLFARILTAHDVCEGEGVVFLDAKQKAPGWSASVTEQQMILRELSGGSLDEEPDIQALAEFRPPTMYYTTIPFVSERPHNRHWDPSQLRELRTRLNSGTMAMEEIDQVAANFMDSEIVDLASDWLGNIIVQKLFEKCSSGPRLAMLERICPHLAMIGIHKNGTWAAQKIIECATSADEVALIARNLQAYVPPLLLDQVGNYVVQCCLCFGAPANDFIFDAIVDRMWEIAQGRFGARSIRACLESPHITINQQRRIATAIILNSIPLATNPNGALLLTWLLNRSGFPSRYNLLAPRFTPHLAHLCTHQLASLTVLRIVNQRVEPEASSQIVEALFSSPGDHVLTDVLGDQVTGVAVVHKILTSPFIDPNTKQVYIEATKRVLIELKVVATTQAYRRLVEEVGLPVPNFQPTYNNTLPPTSGKVARDSLENFGVPGLPSGYSPSTDSFNPFAIHTPQAGSPRQVNVRRKPKGPNDAPMVASHSPYGNQSPVLSHGGPLPDMKQLQSPYGGIPPPAYQP